MSGKQEIIRALDDLTTDSLDQIKVFIDSLKKGKKTGDEFQVNPN